MSRPESTPGRPGLSAKEVAKTLLREHHQKRQAEAEEVRQELGLPIEAKPILLGLMYGPKPPVVDKKEQ